VETFVGDENRMIGYLHRNVNWYSYFFRITVFRRLSISANSVFTDNDGQEEINLTKDSDN
jgi:hypothetical protein